MPTPTTKISIVKFCEDPNLLNLQLWAKQREILTGFFEGNFRVGIWSLGRRSGKTLMSAISAIYAGCVLTEDYKKQLRKGEPFFIVCVANARDQARLALHNIKDLIEASPLLKTLVVRSTGDTLELSNGCIFKALPSSSRTGRGMACPMMIMDEAAHFLDTDGNAAGDQLYQALSPSVAQFGELGKIILLSSPWLQQGLFWDLHKQACTGEFPYMQHINLPTWEVNPTIDKDFLAQEKARDPTLFEIEFGANFSHSLASFLDSNLIESAVSREFESRNPQHIYKGQYYLSLDPAKGNRDLYVACIAHYEDKVFVVDLFHEFKPSFDDGGKKQISISEVESFIELWHDRYQFKEVVLDQFNSQSTIQRLGNRMNIRELTWTSKSKTQAFTKLRELFVGGNISLYRHEKAITQLKNLIVTYRAGGSWSVSGGAGAAVDDFAMALAGAVLAGGDEPPYDTSWLSMI